MPRLKTRFLCGNYKNKTDNSVPCGSCTERVAAAGTLAAGSSEAHIRNKQPERSLEGQMTLSQVKREYRVFGTTLTPDTALAPVGLFTGPLEPKLYRAHFAHDKTVEKTNELNSLKETVKFDWSKMKPKHVEIRIYATDDEADGQISKGCMGESRDLDKEKGNMNFENKDGVNSREHGDISEDNFRRNDSSSAQSNKGLSRCFSSIAITPCCSEHTSCKQTSPLLNQSHLWKQSSTDATANRLTSQFATVHRHAFQASRYRIAALSTGDDHGTLAVNARGTYDQEEREESVAASWPLGKSSSLRSLESPLRSPYNTNQSNGTVLNLDSPEIEPLPRDDREPNKAETYSVSEEREGEHIPEQEVPVAIKPFWLLKTSPHVPRSYCSIQNLQSSNRVNLFSQSAPSTHLSESRGYSGTKWVNSNGGGESNRGCSYNAGEASYRLAQGTFLGVLGEGEAAVNTKVFGGGASADTETAQSGKDPGLTAEDTETEYLRRQSGRTVHARALCSYRFWHKGVKNLLLEEVSQSSSGGYTVEGVSSLSSNGVTISEPARGFDDASDVSSYSSVFECAPSPNVVCKASEALSTDPGDVPAEKCFTEDAGVVLAERYSVITKHSSPILFENGRTVFRHNTTEDCAGTGRKGKSSTAENSMDRDQDDVAKSTEMSTAFAVAGAECDESDSQNETSQPHIFDTGIDVTQEEKIFFETIECSGKPCSGAGLQPEHTMQIDTASSAVWHQLSSFQAMHQGISGTGEDKCFHEEQMTEENHSGVVAGNSILNASGTESETCSSWSTLIDFVQSRSACPVLSPVLRDTEGVSRGISSKVNGGSSERLVQCPRILDLRKENDSSEESFIIDAGMSHMQENAACSFLTHPTSVRMGTSQNGSSSESQASQLQPEAGTSGASLDGVSWDCVPGRCSDVVNEALPLREVWQTVRQQGIDRNLDVESEEYDAVADDETIDSEAEPAAARTASSLELEQNLQMAKVAALQNMSSACPYMPWTGNLDNEARHRQQGAAAGPKRHSESWRGYSTASAECRTGTGRDHTVVIMESAHSMDEDESVEMGNERNHCANRRDSLSRIGPCTQYGRSRRESHCSRHHPYSPQHRTSERRWSRSPVKGRGGSTSTHLANRSPASSSSDVASVCTRSACARRQYMAPDSASTSSTGSPVRHSRARFHPKRGHSFRPLAYRRQCCRRSGRTLSRNLSVPTRIRNERHACGRAGRSLSPHIGVRVRMRREPHPARGNTIRTGPSSDTDSDSDRNLNSYCNAQQRVKKQFSPSRKRGVRFGQLRRVDIFPTSPLTSALMHNRSNNTNSLSSTTFQQASESRKQTMVRHSERQGMDGVAHHPQVTFNPPSPQDPDCTPEGNPTDTPGSPRLPIFSMHTQWHSFVKSSATDTSPWSFQASNTTFFNADKQQPRDGGRRRAKSSLPGKKRHAVSAFSGVDPSKRDREELEEETDLLPSVTEERRVRLKMRRGSGTNIRRHDSGKQQYRHQASRVWSCSHCDRDKKARHRQELLYKHARAVLREMCYLRSKEELLFQAAIRFQCKRLQLQEQHSRLVNRARAVSQEQVKSGFRPYQSPSAEYARYRHPNSHKHRHHGAHPRRRHFDVTACASCSYQKDRKPPTLSARNHEKMLDQPSTSRGPVRTKRKCPDHHCSSRKRPCLARNVDQDRDSETSASRSSPLMHRTVNQNHATTCSEYNADDENEENDEEDEENDDDDDYERCRSSDGSEEGDEGSENEDDEDAADDERKKSGDRLDEEAKSEVEWSDEESDSPRNAGFYREQ